MAIQDDDKIIIFILAALFLFALAIGLEAGIVLGQIHQLRQDSRESINPHPGIEWQKAVIDAHAWVLKEAVQ